MLLLYSSASSFLQCFIPPPPLGFSSLPPSLPPVNSPLIALQRAGARDAASELRLWCPCVLICFSFPSFFFFSLYSRLFAMSPQPRPPISIFFPKHYKAESGNRHLGGGGVRERERGERAPFLFFSAIHHKKSEIIAPAAHSSTTHGPEQQTKRAFVFIHLSVGRCLVN